MLITLSVAVILAAYVAAQNTATGTAAVAAAAATAKTESPTSHVPGKAFNRIAIIWLENTDYNMAVGDRKLFHKSRQEFKLLKWYTANLAYLAKQGILLSNHL